VKIFHVERPRPSMRLIPRLKSDCEPSKVQYIEVLSRFSHAQTWWNPGSRKPRYRGSGPVGPPWLMTAGGRCCAHPAQMAPAHHGVEHLVCGHTTEKLSPRLIASSTLFVDARRSSKTPRPENVAQVARNCTETYSVDWRTKSAFEVMYFFFKHAPTTPLKFWACRA